MRILHLTAHLNTGGITSYLLTLSDELLRRGHQVSVMAADGDATVRFQDKGIQVTTANMRIKSEIHPMLWINLPRLIHVVKKQQINVIHAHTRTTQVLGHVVSFLTGVPLVTTCHGFFKPRFHRRLFGCWGKRIVAISQPVYEHLINDFKLPDSQVSLIVNGIDLVQFPVVDKERRQLARQQLGITHQHVIGLIARLSSVKGIDVLIDAFNQVVRVNSDVLLLIVGEGPEQERLHEQIARLNLQDKVCILKTVNKTAAILPVFDVVIAPSRMEGLGLSVMEAMASGLPVIASRVGGLIDLITDNQDGLLVKPVDANELSEAIIKLLADHHTQIRLANNARMRIADKFTSVQMAEKTIRVYEDISR